MTLLIWRNYCDGSAGRMKEFSGHVAPGPQVAHLRKVAVALTSFFYPGSVCPLGESGRSESCTALRSPKEERPEIVQLRQVKPQKRPLGAEEIRGRP